MCAEVLPGVSFDGRLFLRVSPVCCARDFVRGVRVRDGRRVGAGVPQPQDLSKAKAKAFRV